MITKRRSKDWNDVRDKCELLIEQEKIRIETVKTLEELRECQGKIAAYRTILMMEDVHDAQD